MTMTPKVSHLDLSDDPRDVRRTIDLLTSAAETLSDEEGVAHLLRKIAAILAEQEHDRQVREGERSPAQSPAARHLN